MIFIVDDDEAVRDSLQLLLECDGLPVQGFASARAFLDADRRGAARTGERDCLIVDVHMPDGGGLDLVEELRRRGCALPVIVVTGRPSAANGHRAGAAGALAMLEKPYDGKRLLELVRRAVGQGTPPPAG